MHCVSSHDIIAPVPSNQTNSESRVALYCLVHPASLLALALLALNDHWFKGLGPGWLTGKLSDFAGLFYFPFLIIIFVGLVPVRAPRPRLLLGRCVFWATGIWFATAKSIPVVHRATVWLAESLVGEVQIIRDPSDALALIALVPAWLLYRHKAAADKQRAWTAFQPALVGVALLLTAATSKPYEPTATGLIVHEGRLHAIVSNSYDLNASTPQTKTYSTDDGVKWFHAELPNELIRTHISQLALSSGDTRIAIIGQDVVDGGDGLSWSLPVGRKSFMPLVGGRPWRAMDIAFVPGTKIVVVALGTEGVVRRGPKGKWSRHSVGGTTPSRLQVGWSKAVSLVLSGQWIFGAAVALIAWVLMSLLVWLGGPETTLPKAKSLGRESAASKCRFLVRGIKSSFSSLGFRQSYLMLGVLALILSGIILISYLCSFPTLPTSLGYIFYILIASLPTLWAWVMFNSNYKAVKKRSKHFLISIATGLVCLGLLLLWDVNWIESFVTTLCLSAAIVVAVVLYRAAGIGNSR